MRSCCLILGLALAACAGPRTPATRAVLPDGEAPAKSSTGPAARSFHDFRPSVHGFPFRNGFQGRILGTGENSYGLCGGMSFAAADYFLAQRPIPGGPKAPAEGTPLHEYLYARQAASFGAFGVMGLKFVEWMQLPDEGEDSVQSRTLSGLPAIRRTLARGEPVVLGLVLNRTGEKAWDNHQVLALDEQTEGETTTIRIYDPNFPKRDDIIISVAHDGSAVPIRQHIPGRGTIVIRGFFRMAYRPAAPPK